MNLNNFRVVHFRLLILEVGVSQRDAICFYVSLNIINLSCYVIFRKSRTVRAGLLRFSIFEFYQGKYSEKCNILFADKDQCLNLIFKRKVKHTK